MQQFRSRLYGTGLPSECSGCELKEQTQGRSLRTAVNDTQDLNQLKLTWPSRWNVKFGNICNLACWSCSEHSSSVIETHKIRVGLLPADHEPMQKSFAHSWPTIRQNILRSYDCHSTVTITVLGGEPLYNPTVIDFLHELQQLELSARTRLEFHTNATKITDSIRSILDRRHWRHISVFFSLDAVGAKAQWLRYGCDWNQVVDNIALLRSLVNYSEAHCTVSVLNIRDLAALGKFCQDNQLDLRLHALSTPEFMSCENWDADPGLLLQGLDRTDPKLVPFYDLVGKNPRSGAASRLCDYIQRFAAIRDPLDPVDPGLAKILNQVKGHT